MRRHLAACLASSLIAAASAPSAWAERADRERPAAPAADGDDPRFACGKAKGAFAVSFKDEVELRDLVAWAMGFSCKRFVYASSLASRSAKLTIITPGTVSAGEAWSIFEVGLEAMGLTAVPKGGVLELVESAQAKDAALAIRRAFPDDSGAPVRLLIRPDHVGVDDLRAAIELVKSRHGVVSALPNLRAILVTDDGRHVARMKSLVAELDRPADGAGVYAVPVTHRDAVELVTVLEPLLAEPAGGGAGATGGGARTSAAPRLSADRKVNAVFVVGSAAQHARVRALVGALDVADGDDAKVHAVRLRNAAAKDVAATLAPLLASGGAAAGGAGGGPAATGAPTGSVRVTADEGTNALLFLASARDAVAVRAMIAELDAPRRQVYIEAMVLEVEASNERQLGVSWHQGRYDPTTRTTTVGGVQSKDVSSIVPQGALTTAKSTAFLGGVFGKALESTLLGQSVPSFGVLVSAAAHRGELEVLASPHLMALDNKPATISIGNNIPYKSSSATPTTTGVPIPAQIERRDVALKLTITPHVAPAAPGELDGDRIRLELKLEDAQLGTEDFGDGLGPTWKERLLETSVVLRDQDSLVLGGLLEERVEKVVDGVPVLSDLPLLGALFRSTRTVKSKSNLLIVLTPTLVDDSEAGRRILDRRMREREEFDRASADLARRTLAPRVDYRRKRGLLAEIDATVRAVEVERAALEAIRRPVPPRGRIDVEPEPAPAPEPSPPAP